MTKHFPGRVLAAGTALLALGLGAAPANADTYIYNYYGERGTTMQYDSPVPRTDYYRAPVYSAPPNTTYFYGPSTSPYAPPSSAYYYNPPPSAYYVPPGLSITTPLGTYAPFYGGYSAYSSPDHHDPYRTAPGH